MSTENNQRATLSLTVSLCDTGQTAYRIQIPMEKIEVSPSSSIRGSLELIEHTSSSGSDQKIETLRQSLKQIDLRSIARASLQGDFAASPVEVALAMLMESITELVEKADGTDQPE